jgi:hypothetical protein
MAPTVALTNAEEPITGWVISAADVGDAIVWREVHRARISQSHRPP